jgi:hypothetical protein
VIYEHVTALVEGRQPTQALFRCDLVYIWSKMVSDLIPCEL